MVPMRIKFVSFWSHFFWKLWGIPFCFSLRWEGQLNIYKKTSARFQNWPAFRFVFHCILWLILCAEYGPRGKECAPAALEAERGTTAHEAENRFWTMATPIVHTFGHGGGSCRRQLDIYIYIYIFVYLYIYIFIYPTCIVYICMNLYIYCAHVYTCYVWLTFP